MSKHFLGKSLKGLGTLSEKFSGPIENGFINLLNSGAVALTNVNITGGTINGTTSGNDDPAPGYFTTLQSGNAQGQGYSVCFYGQTIGDSACWLPIDGKWQIQGDLAVRDISDLGNLRIVTNTLSSTNTNGNVVIDPNGTGSLVVAGGISQNASQGNLTYNTANGLYSLSTTSTITSTSGTKTTLNTNDGDITFNTGLNLPLKTINFITSGLTPNITTTAPHGYNVGDKIEISGTNSMPNINGIYMVTGVPSTTTFTITPGYAVTASGTTGSIIHHNDINLNATNNVNIPVNVGLTFGGNSQQIIADSVGNLTVTSKQDIFLTPPSGYTVNIPDNVALTFGPDDDIRKITSDGTNLNLDVGLGNFVVNGNMIVNGTTTTVNSTTVTIKDPVIVLGGDTPPLANDLKDRGVEFRWHNGTSAKDGFFGFQNSTKCFTYIPDAVNTNEVFTGAPGCMKVGSLSATSLNMQGGSINNIGVFDACNITCSSNMTISAVNSISLTSPSITTNGNFTSNGTTATINNTNTVINSNNISTNDRIITIGSVLPLTSNDLKDRGIEFRYYQNTISKLGFFGWDDSLMKFTFYTDVTNNNEVISGTLGDVLFNNGSFSTSITTPQVNTCNIVCNSNLNITSPTTTVNGNLVVTGTINGTSILTTEHLSISGGGNVSPSTNINITFITVTSSGAAQGVLNLPTVVINDGYQKHIMISNLASGGKYYLSCPSGVLLDPGSGTTNVKTLKFEYPGQSIYLIYNNVLNAYMITNGGVCIS